MGARLGVELGMTGEGKELLSGKDKIRIEQGNLQGVDARMQPMFVHSLGEIGLCAGVVSSLCFVISCLDLFLCVICTNGDSGTSTRHVQAC